jgi:hypothetical protein
MAVQTSRRYSSTRNSIDDARCPASDSYVVAASLQEQGFIHYRRASLTIVDRHAPERAFWECYEIGKQSFQRLLPELPPVSERGKLMLAIFSRMNVMFVWMPTTKLLICATEKGSTVPHTINCRHCHRTGWVRAETIVKGSTAFKLLYCGYCDYTWRRIAEGKDLPIKTTDADRAERQTGRRCDF